ncbi:MAG: hypothetical protein J6Y82_12835 [Bacteroidales bacterium]|nr:hypothetical protein [Bacteroidales bacterium]
MKYLKTIGCLAIAAILGSCNKPADSIDVHQSSRDNVIDVRSLIHGIDLGDGMFNRSSFPVMAGKYLVIGDYLNDENAFCLFDGDNYKYIKSFGRVGQGPNEIVSLASFAWNKYSQEFCLIDEEGPNVYACNLDSIVSNPDYTITEKYKTFRGRMPSEFFFVDDTTAYCVAYLLLDEYTADRATGIWHTLTGEIDCMQYVRPDVPKRHFVIAVSPADDLYAECHFLCDFISIFDMKGNLIRNIFGPDWGTDDLDCFCSAIYTKDYLVTAYNGVNYKERKPVQRCVIFSKTGDYVATLNLGYATDGMCYDEKYNRLIFTFNDEIQLGYLNLDDLDLK